MKTSAILVGARGARPAARCAVALSVSETLHRPSSRLSHDPFDPWNRARAARPYAEQKTSDAPRTRSPKDLTGNAVALPCVLPALAACAALVLAGCSGLRRPTPAPCAAPPTPCADASELAIADVPCGPAPCAPCSPCTADWYAGVAPIYLPGIGLSLEVGRVFARTPTNTWSVEARGTYEFLDNTMFISGSSGSDWIDWKSAEVGVKVSRSPEAYRHLTGRFGASVARYVGGDRHIVQDDGWYYGLYAGIGFETELSDRLTVGPRLTPLLIAGASDRAYAVPQLEWHAIWSLGGSTSCAPKACERPVGDFYAGLSATAFPGIGASAEFGQVFARTDRATWSFEVQATRQYMASFLGGESGAGNDDDDYASIRGGFKVSLSPCSCRHLVARLGATAFRSTFTSDTLDVEGTYNGFYAGLGYEFDLSDRWTTGPEATAMFGWQEGNVDNTAFLPQVGWHLIYRF